MRNTKKATPEYLERVALWYLERHGGCEARVRRVLGKRVVQSIGAYGEPSPQDAQLAIDAVIAKLHRLGYLDDVRFARARAKALRAKGKSTRAIRSALRRVGLDGSIVEGAIEGDDLEAARVWVRRRRLSGGPKDLAKLARAGFSYDVAKRALGSE